MSLALPFLSWFIRDPPLCVSLSIHFLPFNTDLVMDLSELQGIHGRKLPRAALVLKTQFLTEPGAAPSARLASWPSNSRDPPISASPELVSALTPLACSKQERKEREGQEGFAFYKGIWLQRLQRHILAAADDVSY